MASFCSEFWKFLYLCGFIYFVVMGTLVLFKFEPTEVKKNNSTKTAVSCYAVAIINLVLFIYIWIKNSMSSTKVNPFEQSNSNKMYEPFIDTKSETDVPLNREDKLEK